MTVDAQAGAISPADGLVTVHLRIKRYNPETDTRPHWQEFELRMKPSDTVLNALHEIKWTQDGTLTFRRSCAHGVCGSDAMVINGENKLGCINLISDVGTDLTIEPIRGLPVIKDLVVDMEPFFAQYRSVLPFLIANDDPGYKERYQSPEDRERFDDTTKC
ncbi:MAG: 2Fe-2S iron-sulfur cluster-binding protein, partial [Acidimicrobiales bacterium]